MGVLIGFLCAAVSVLFFGSNFAVVAKYDPGDGMFFQFMLCLGIWFTGLLVQVLRGAPTFYPVAMIGGSIWCTGNCLTVFIIKRIGLGPGLVMWGTSALIIGWLTGFFGLFGLPSEQNCLRSPWLNVVGLFLSMCALVDSSFVKKGSRAHVPEQAEEITALEGTDCTSSVQQPVLLTPGERSKGMLAAVLAGICYGLNFLPSSWIQDHVGGASTNGLHYVFNQFCGIFATSTFYFLVYCALKGNKPAINPEIVLPGFLSGTMWAVGQSCWFVANAELGYSAAFPIILIGPGFVGSMWSVFLFKDIYGRKNFYFLAGYFCLAVAACACIVISRKTDGKCN